MSATPASPARMFDLVFVGNMKFHDWPHSPHTMVVRRIPPGSRVFDVGCSVGHVAAELGKKQCKVWGVDGDAEATREAARHCEEVAVADFDVVRELPFAGRVFDDVLLLDVLEHLARPDRLLPLVAERVRPGGRVWISLPNVARIENRWKLLLGRFDYEDGATALSKGHLRFFTRKSAIRMIEASGFRVVSVQGTGLASILKSWGVSFFQTLTAFQFIFECVRAEQGEPAR